jgi:acetyl esterase/lipase
LALAMPAYAADAPHIRIVKDIAYVRNAHDDDGKNTLDLYLPLDGEGAPSRTASRRVPVVVSFYGGQLMAGDKSEEVHVGERLAAAGFATAVVNYRLTPTVTHPGHVQDAAASVAWVKRHIAEYGGDPDNLFLIGHSAGAYLVSLLSTDERYLAAQNMSLSDVRGVVPVSAFYYVEKTGVAPDRDKRVWGTDPKVWIDASPAHHLHARVPPTLMLYADGDEDWRRGQNRDMFEAMKKAGNTNVSIAMIESRSHMSIWWKLGEEKDETAEHIIAFVRRTTRGLRASQ